MNAILILVIIMRAAQVDLALPADPAEARAPRSLAMRAEGPAQPPTPPPTQTPTPTLDAVTPPSPAAPFSLEEIAQKLVFKFNIGYAVEQGEPQQGKPLPTDVRGTRVSNYGDVVLGTKGLAWAPLSTYLAAHFFVDTDGAATMAAVPSVFDAAQDGRALLVRSAWAQLSGIGPPLLAPLTLRAGRQFRYGVAIAHFDGASGEYVTPLVELAGFFGRRVALYGAGSDPFALGKGSAGVVGGGSVKLRPPKVPLAFGVDYFGFENADHLVVSGELDLARDGAVRAWARLRNGVLAETRAEARARFGRTTTLAVELDDRLRDDWMYDFVLTGRLTGQDDPRRWLNLGPTVSRLQVSVRGGTVLFDNWDVLVTASAGIPHGGDSSFAPRYVELGAALLARFPFGIEAGVETRIRESHRIDVQGTTIPLADIGALGERSFIEGSTTLRWSLGARRFSAEIAAFARRWGQAPLGAEPVADVAAGGRFGVVGWAAGKVQLRGEYEVAGIPDRTSEQLTGLQTLRVLLEATF
ncbi:MAG TPA: hypothetical protein VKE22_04975 [Haliangiales bacterium]|nr:hypothetical protein [Haliangiales bacterium]